MKTTTKLSTGAGYSLLELVVVLGIILIMGAVALPGILGFRQEAALVGAAQGFKAQFMRARSLATSKNTQTAIRFETDADGTPMYSTYIDGNFNGVYSSEITAGIDTRIADLALLVGGGPSEQVVQGGRPAAGRTLPGMLCQFCDGGVDVGDRQPRPGGGRDLAGRSVGDTAPADPRSTLAQAPGKQADSRLDLSWVQPLEQFGQRRDLRGSRGGPGNRGGVSSANRCASTTANAAMFTMSRTDAPVGMTWTARAMPWRIGPTAAAPPRRLRSL